MECREKDQMQYQCQSCRSSELPFVLNANVDTLESFSLFSLSLSLMQNVAVILLMRWKWSAAINDGSLSSPSRACPTRTENASLTFWWIATKSWLLHVCAWQNIIAVRDICTASRALTDQLEILPENCVLTYYRTVPGSKQCYSPIKKEIHNFHETSSNIENLFTKFRHNFILGLFFFFFSISSFSSFWNRSRNLYIT